MSCNIQHKKADYGIGVSYELAKSRFKQIDSIEYNLNFNIPQNEDSAVVGKLELFFDLKNKNEDVVLDFQNNADNVLSVSINSQKSDYIFENEHIVIPAKELKIGKNCIKIDFISGNSSLNRHSDYLYTLFVPDKASIVFPCFDQPDMKAKFSLSLTIPDSWNAMSNGKIVKDTIIESSRHLKFDKTKIISTYLFAFVAGKFESIQQTKNGRTINFYYLESDKEKIKNNADTLFAMHFMSLSWMEKYTGIKYPFKKLDFVTIPSFQFSGMEHVGGIFYRASRMLLSESPSIEDVAKRAAVIAHEVSHMWFGNLVTMKWFNDVWLKEVYAELFASKMVNPMFPDVNHDLNFIIANYPRSYRTERSRGTHPIIQSLDNLKFAGTLYDDIIYFKAPIVMAKLEQLIGEEAMQKGLIDYLQTYSYGNAEWSDLIHIFDKYTKFDLDEWNKMWVMQEGMPTISADVEYENNKISKFTLKQKDSSNKNKLWKQELKIVLCKNGKKNTLPIYLDKAEMDIDKAKGLSKPDFILINGGAYGYGYFVLDEMSKKYLLKNTYKIKDDLLRTMSYISLFQAVINYNLDAASFLDALTNFVIKEHENHNLQLILNYIETTWDFFTSKEQHKKFAPKLENTLMQIAKSTNNNEVKSAIFETLITVFESRKMQNYLFDLWKKQKDFTKMKLSDAYYSKIALTLSLRDYPNADSIANEQLNRISEEEQKLKFKFIMAAASPDIEKRDRFFEKLKDAENRKHEIWVRRGLSYLHHPLRADYSVKYLPETLDMLEEIQQTGDIFFPKNWLLYSIGKYNTKEANDIVNRFLAEHPKYNKNLRYKILQTSDYLFRANKMRGE